MKRFLIVSLIVGCGGSSSSPNTEDVNLACQMMVRMFDNAYQTCDATPPFVSCDAFTGELDDDYVVSCEMMLTDFTCPAAGGAPIFADRRAYTCVTNPNP